MKKIVFCSMLSVIILGTVLTLPYSVTGAEQREEKDDTLCRTIEVTNILKEADELILDNKFEDAEAVLVEASEKYDDDRISYKLKELDKKHWDNNVQICSDASGKELSHIEREYNEKGELIKNIHINNDPDAMDDMQWILEYEYSDSGKVLSEKLFDGDYNSLRSSKYKYDKDDVLYECVEVNESSTKIMKYTWKDGELDEVETTSIDKDGNIVNTLDRYFKGERCESFKEGVDGTWIPVMKQYYENGLKTKCVTYDEDGNENIEFEYVYDERGNVVKYFCQLAEPIIAYLDFYTYNRDGLLETIESYTYYDGEEDAHRLTSYEYDTNKNIIEEICVDLYDESEISHIEYTYNEYSLLTNRIEAAYNAVENETWEFDEDGILIRYIDEVGLTGEGYTSAVPGSHEIVYNRFGHELENHSVSKDDSFDTSHVYRDYNRDENITNEAIYDSNETLVASKIYRYDRDGLLIRVEWMNESGKGYDLYMNDEYGNAIRIQRFDADNNLISEINNEYRYLDF